MIKTSTSPFSTTKYCVIFSITYFVLLLLLNLAPHVLNTNVGAGSNIGALLASGIFTAFKFVSDHKRVPDRSEKRKLIWGSYVASILASIIIAGILFSMMDAQDRNGIYSLLKQLPAFMITAAALIITGLYYACFSVTYGPLSKAILKMVQQSIVDK